LQKCCSLTGIFATSTVLKTERGEECRKRLHSIVLRGLKLVTSKALATKSTPSLIIRPESERHLLDHMHDME
jgi:hypothetical protein